MTTDPTAPATSRPPAFPLTGAEQFWYALQCIWFGRGYLVKVVYKKGLSEMPQLPQAQVGLMPTP
jgi:hypothetical protein